MQSDSSSCKVEASNDATSSRQVNDAWVKGLENLESMFTDENKFRDENKDDHLKDATSSAFPSASDVLKGCLSPSNLLNDCTNRSTDNSSDKQSDKPSDKLSDLPGKPEKSDKPNDKSTPDKMSNKSAESPRSSSDSCSTSSKASDAQDDDDEAMETNSKSSESEEDEEMNDRSEQDDKSDEENSEEEDDEDEEDEEEENREKTKEKNKKRKAFNERKNIKKLIKEEDLDESILNARRQEEERIARIMEHLKSEQQQKQLVLRKPPTEDIVLSSDEEEDVQIIETSDKDKEEDEDIVTVFEKVTDELDATNSGLHTDDSLNRLNKNGRCLINVGHPSDEPDVFLDDYLAKKVKPHQIGGIRFMYDCVIESIAKVKTSDGIGGCILAHSMGMYIVKHTL